MILYLFSIDKAFQIEQGTNFYQIHLYNQIDYNDVELFNNTFVVTGGYNNGNSLSNAFGIKLIISPPKIVSIKVTPISDMNQKRNSHSLIEVYKNLYCIGGYDWSAQKYLKVNEKLSSTVEKWKFIPSLNVPNEWLTICKVNKKIIYVFGGSKNSVFEKYDTEKATR